MDILSPNRDNNALIIGYVSLMSIVLSVCYISMGTLVWSWDDGNLLYDSWRVLQGQIPNHDFVSGYPGGHNFLIALFMKLFGETASVAHLYIVCSAILIASLVYGLTARFIGVPLAILAGYAATRHGVFVWWSPMPSMFGQIGFLVMLAVLFGVANDRLKALNWGRYFILGLLLGITFSFRQAAVFIGVSLVYVFWWVFVIRYPDYSGKIFKICVVAIGCILPVIFFILRVSARYPIFNYIALLPWVLVVCYLCAMTASRKIDGYPKIVGNESYAVKLLAIASAGYIIGITPLAAIYVCHGVSLLHVFQEIMIRVPTLIDRHIVPATLDARGCSEILVFITCAFGVVYATQISSSWSKRIYATLGIAGISLLAWFIIGMDVSHDQNISYYYLKRMLMFVRLDVLAYQFWGTVAVVAIAFFLLICRKSCASKVSSSNMDLLTVLFIASGPYFANMYPYPNSLSSTGVTLLMIAATLAVFKDIAGAMQSTPLYSAGKRYCAIKSAKYAPLIMMILIVATLGYVQIKSVNKYIAVNEERWKGRAANQTILPFLQLAKYIEQLPIETTVATYPNMALSLFLSGRLTPLPYGNYLGDFDRDFHGLINDIKQKSIDVVIVNPKLYPYGPTFPYFPDPMSLISQLLDRYYLADRISCFDIYKLKPTAFIGKL